MDKEDIRLKELFESNPKEAFEMLFIRYYKPMVLTARIYSANHPESEDIVQHVFVKFWEDGLHSKINTSFRHYLHISVRNNCFNHLKQLKIRQQYKPDPEQESQVEQAVDFMLNKEESDVFEKAYSELPPQSRKAFEMVYFAGQSYQSAAETLSVSVNTVKSHLKTALRKLKNSTLLNNYYRERKKS